MCAVRSVTIDFTQELFGFHGCAEVHLSEGKPGMLRELPCPPIDPWPGVMGRVLRQSFYTGFCCN